MDNVFVKNILILSSMKKFENMYLQVVIFMF